MNITLTLKHELLTRDLAQQAARIERETATPPTPATISGATPGGDERRLRGIPAIGRNVAGAIPGTSPHALT